MSEPCPADLPALLRDITDRLDSIEYALKHTEAFEEHVAQVARGLNACMTTRPGHWRSIRLAVESAMVDMEARQSLIRVDEDDSEYEQHCVSCVLTKNGYPRLAQLYADSRPGDGEHDNLLLP
jgi:hypothetical protein